MKKNSLFRAVAIAAVAVLSVLWLSTASAQVSFTPSTLTWSAEDTSPKTVTVHSPGWWDTDSTSLDSHFSFSRYNGVNGYEIEVTPLTANTSGSNIVENIAFWDNSGMYYLQLAHNAVANTLSVSPSSLSWAFNSTAGKTLSINCSGSWTAGTEAPWVQLSAQSGDGENTITVTPLTANPSGSTRSAVLYVRCGSSLVRSVTLTQSGNPSSSTIAVSPSAFVWDAEDTSPKAISLASEGSWYTDSTGAYPSLFTLSSTSGTGDTILSVWPQSTNILYNDIVEELELKDEYGHSAYVTLRQRRRFTEDPSDTTNRAWAAVTGASFDKKVNPDSLAAFLQCHANSSGGAGYDARQIPIEAGTTPTGGRAYAMTVPTASGLGLVPEVGLSYNSQGGNGIAGFGWGISGLSSISIIPKTRYWHGTQSAARTDDADAKWALDGVPLLDNEGPDFAAAYPLVSARGLVYAKAHRNVEGELTHFDVAYPDGTKATYGWSDSESTNAVYPITEKTDMYGNRITYEYAQPEDGGTDYRITAIKYGYDGNGAPAASILFEYAQRADKVTAYYAGTKFTNGYLLKGITSRNGAETLAEYSLTHELCEDASLLKQIGCSDGGSHILPPVTFDYVVDECSGIPAALLPESTTGVVYNYEPETFYQHIRGHFYGGQAADGVVSWPAKPRYERKKYSGGTISYGSGYDGDETITIYPSIGNSSPLTANTEWWFQTVEAIDTNGDGLDELVKINFSIPATDQETPLRIKIYDIGDTGLDLTKSFVSSVKGSVRFGPGSNSYSPAPLDYVFGDYDGDGAVDLAVISSCRDGNGDSHISYVALVDLQSGTKQNEKYCFEHYVEIDEPIDNYCLLSIDIDADGRSELVRISGEIPTIQVFGCASLSEGFILESTWSFLPSSAWNHGGPFVTDVNGDGYLDFVVVESNGSASAWFYTGAGYENRPLPGLTVGSSDELTFADVNHDGLTDALVKTENGWMKVALNRNGCGFHSGDVRECYLGRFNANLVPFNLFDTYGISGVVSIGGTYMTKYAFTRDRSLMRLVRSNCDGAGNLTGTGYGNIMTRGANAVYSENVNRLYSSSDGYLKYAFPSFVVASTAGRSEDSIVAKNSYSYKDAAHNNRGLGFCGFGTVTATDYVGSTVTVNTLDPEKYGVAIAQTISLIDASSPFSSATYAYDSHTGIGGKADPRLVQSTVTDVLTGIITTSAYSYDTYDQPTQVVTTRKIGANGTPQMETLQATYSHSLTGNLYLLGSVTEQTVTRNTDGNAQSVWKTRTVTTYDVHYNPTNVKTYTGTTGTNLENEQNYSYDAKGNVLSKGEAAYGATTFNTTTYAYDASGRYLTSSTDPLGRTTTYQNYDKYGTPLTRTNWLGQNTVVTCDAWGNPIQTTHPDGTVESTALTWCVNGGPGVLCVTNTTSGHPTVKAWYDALGREVCSAEQRFDEVWMRSYTEYDSRGRVVRKSLPLRDDAHGSYQWNIYGYDAFDRPVRLTEASGKQTTWSYSGTSITTTKEGISSTSTTDAEGNVVSVDDAGGTITYALRDDGQPSSVTVTPNGTSQNIVTTFQYDTYGRRSSIVDPSAGTRTDTYTDNADGSSSVAHTGPNGTVTTNYDRFGRVTSVTRPEFNTIYTYGTTLNSSSYGKLLSETSTNGTSRSFTYDGYGRTASETEYADAGHWMQKSYVYGAGSNVASISYATQAGTITTESYTWTNGHNTGISLPDGTVVFALTAENDLGQPTAVNSGNVSRTYSFTSAGLPSVRQIRNSQNETVQDLRYSYNAANGNMTWRKDNVLGITESFSYDNLNRLTSANESWNEWTPTEYLYNNAGTTFNSKGNVTGRSYDSQFSLNILYGDPADPYKSTGSEDIGGENLSFITGASATTTSFDRPAGISFDGENAYLAYVYNGGGEKSRASMSDVTLGVSMNRWYIGGVYEKDENTGDSITENAERLFLGGTAYDAPMVLVKAASVNNGVWTPFNIGRDVQGSITEVMTVDGDVVERFRYDPWGIQMDGKVDPVDSLAVEDEIIDTLIALSPLMRTGLSVYVGSHGYTGHEHIYGTGFINCNARLYDPFIGRFLAPDPLIQDPSSTQNFNRYSYCLNNPLKYTDESGEFVISATSAILISAAVFAFGNLGAHAIRGDDLGHGKWAKYFFSGAIAGAVVGASWNFATPLINAPFEAMAGSQSWVCRLIGKQTLFNLKHAYTLMTGINFVGNLYNGIANNNDQWFNNFGKSVLGQFYLDENRNFMGQVWEGISRHTWEGLQQFLGYSWTSLRSPWNDRIDFFGGATFGTYFNGDRGPAATLGSYININSNESNSVIDSYNSFDDYIMSIRDMADEYYTHEFGHTIQSKIWGVFYFAPALMSMWNLRNGATIDHDHYWTETYANSYSYYYFEKHFPSYAFNKSTKPCKY